MMIAMMKNVQPVIRWIVDIEGVNVKVARKIDFSGFLIFDGGMGTMLQAHAIKIGELPESYNILHPDIVEKIHCEYVEAGADIITANTFGANRYKLKGSEYGVKEIIENGVAIARRAAKYRLVALTSGPSVSS